MYLFLPSYIKDIAEAILVLLVVGNFIFQPINETLRLWRQSTFLLLAFCSCPAPVPRYLLFASLNFHVMSSEK